MENIHIVMGSYKTFMKSCLKDFTIIQDNPIELQLFKCDQCSHETKWKSNFKNISLFIKISLNFNCLNVIIVLMQRNTKLIWKDM